MNSKYFCATWASSQYLTEPFNMPPLSLSNNSLRQIIHTSIGGNKIRIKFSNRVGNAPLEINTVTIAKSYSPGSGKIISETSKAVFFDTKQNITISEGSEIYSDILDFSFEPLSELSITINFGKVPDQLTGHPGSRTNSFIEKGNQVEKEQFDDTYKCTHWYVLAGIEVETTADNKAVICFGDSITDGRGSTDDMQNRWTDNFSFMLNANPDTKNTAVINQGIGGTCISSNGVERFERDVLLQSGIKYLIIFYGINDIIYLNASAQKIITTYKDMICKAHKKDIKVYGCTILPCGNFGEFNKEKDKIRLEVNNWIRENAGKNDGFDAFFNFEEVMADPNDISKLSKPFDCGDGLHPSAEGYKQIVTAIKDFNLFV